MKNITVIKIGGSTFSSRDTTIEDIVSLQNRGESLVIIHGGGTAVTEWFMKQGVPTQFVRGERVTDKAALEVVTAVLAGLVNKEIVASINSKGGRAVGISGVDGAVIEGKMKSPEMGYMGTVEKVNPAVLETLLNEGFVPVVSPVSLHTVDRPDDAPQIINLNGDPVAGDIAAALGAERLIFLTDVDGIRDEAGTVVSRLSAGEAEALVASGVVSGGMIPKINACLKALTAGSVARIIDGRKPHALVKEIEGQDSGTVIYKD